MSDDVFSSERARMEKLLWESIMGSNDPCKHLFDPGNASGTSCVTGGNDDYEALSSERIALLNAQFSAMRSGNAYLVCPPEFANALAEFPAVQFESQPIDGMRFKVFTDFGVKLVNKHLGIPISTLYTVAGGSDPVYVPRPAVVEPESPSAFQWCIVVVVLIGLLYAMEGAL